MKRLNRFILILVVFFCTSLCFAQMPALKWGPVSKGDRVKGSLKSIGWSDDAFYAIQHRSNDTKVLKSSDNFLEKMSSDLELIFSKKIKYSPEINISFIENNILHVIYPNTNYYSQTKGSKIEIKCSKFDLNGELIGDEILSEVYDIPRTKYPDGFNRLYSQSPNKEYYLISELIRPKKFDKILRIRYIKISRKNLNDVKIYEKEINLIGDIDQTILHHSYIDNYGNMAMIVGERKDEKDPFLLKIHSIYNDNIIQESYELKLEDYYLQISNINSSKSGKVFFTGLYLTQRDNKNLYNGFFLAEFDMGNNTIANLSSVPYDNEFFESLGYRIKKDGTVNFKGIYTMNIILNEEKGGYITAEHFHNYDREIVVMRFDEEGKFKYRTVIPRITNQYGGPINKGYSEGGGFFPIVKNDLIYLLYSDLEKNLEINNLEKLKVMKDLGHNKVVCVAAVIDKDGNLSRNILFKNKDVGGFLIPSKCSELDDNYTISIINKSKVRYAKLLFDY